MSGKRRQRAAGVSATAPASAWLTSASALGHWLCLGSVTAVQVEDCVLLASAEILWCDTLLAGLGSVAKVLAVHAQYMPSACHKDQHSLLSTA